MTNQDIRALLDESADFQREGDLTAALARANEAVAACESLSLWGESLMQEAVLVRDRCALALTRARTDDLRRGQRYYAREEREPMFRDPRKN